MGRNCTSRKSLFFVFNEKTMSNKQRKRETKEGKEREVKEPSKKKIKLSDTLADIIADYDVSRAFCSFFLAVPS